MKRRRRSCGADEQRRAGEPAQGQGIDDRAARWQRRNIVRSERVWDVVLGTIRAGLFVHHWRRRRIDHRQEHPGGAVIFITHGCWETFLRRKNIYRAFRVEHQQKHKQNLFRILRRDIGSNRWEKCESIYWRKSWGWRPRTWSPNWSSLGIRGRKAQSSLEDEEVTRVRAALAAQEKPQVHVGEEKVVADRVVTADDENLGEIQSRETIVERRVRTNVIRRRTSRVEVQAETPCGRIQSSRRGCHALVRRPGRFRTPSRSMPFYEFVRL